MLSFLKKHCKYTHFGAILTLCSAFPVSAAIRTITPSEDAYTQNGVGFNDNSLKVESSDRKRISYLKFDTSAISGDYSSATLRLTEGNDLSGSSMTLRFFRGASNNWTETNISAASAPAKGAEIAAFSDNLTDGEVKEVNVLSFVNRPDIYTIVIEADPSTLDLEFSSSESATPPLLILNTSGSVVSPVDLPDSLPPYDLPTSSLSSHGISTGAETQDLDGDGFPDIWAAMYGAQGLDPNADSDGDGQSNKQEAAFGTNPFDPYSSLELEISEKDDDEVTVSWTFLDGRPGILQSSTDINRTDVWNDVTASPSTADGMHNLDVNTTPRRNFFRVANSSVDNDRDGVADWLEPMLGFSTTKSDSAYQARSYDTDGDGESDVELSGDLAAFNEIYRKPETGVKMTRAQAARFLLQTTFGAASMDKVDHVSAIGAEQWIDDQIALPATLNQTYVDAIKTDFKSDSPSDSLRGYYINDNTFIGGLNYNTAWMRAVIAGEDQLRQRVAFALSQILVASRNAAGLANKPRATANYYDLFLKHTFGNYEELLMEVSLHPFMGTYLSHIGNKKANPSTGTYPDENYAREIMQLFSIGLWELYPDGTRILDGDNEPVETYDTDDITNVAEVFTGVNYNANNFGGGYNDDGDSDGRYMTTSMKVFASEHDFTVKDIPIGIQMSGGEPVLDSGGRTTRMYHRIPARDYSNDNALQDVKDCVYQLVRHPNCAPFVCRQLIQFLVSSNPSPEYVRRVASVFVDNGSGETGDLEAVIKAILLDDEARNPLKHLEVEYFGHLREPIIRVVHLGRMLKLDQYDELLWWFFNDYIAVHTLQEPMGSPSVFNYYRPDYSLFGQIANANLESPAFGIVNSYSAISFPNYLWRICEQGFKFPYGDRWYVGRTFPPDFSDLAPIAANIPDLLDHLSILYCGGTLSAESRTIITEALQEVERSGSINNGNKNREKARLAAYLVLMSPEGACTK